MQPRILFVTALLFAAAVPAQVSHYWVDALNGSDFNPGTRAQPFQSLTWAVSVNTTDVHVHVLPGVYSPSTTGDFHDPVTLAPRRIDLSGTQNLKITGVHKGLCILDFGAGPGIWGYIKIAAGSVDIEISDLTMRNAGVDPWGNGAITVDTGAQGVDIHNCYFEQTYSTLIVWAGHDVAFHDNVITDAVPNTGAWPSVGVRVRTNGSTGDRTYIYNNTFYAIGQGISWSNDAGNPQQWIENNVTLDVTAKAFPNSAYPGAHVVFENNLAFNSGTWNYDPVIGPNGTGPLLSATNLEVDPMLVNPAAGVYSPASGSPCIESGSVTTHPYMLNDYLGNNRAVDADDNGIAIPDRGAVESTDLTLIVSNFAQGQTATVDAQTTSPPGTYALGFLFISFSKAPAYNPWWGMAGPDTTAMASIMGAPGTQFLMPIPTGAQFNDQAVYMQFYGIKAAPSGLVLKGSGTTENHM